MYPNDFQYLDSGQFERLTGTDAIRKGTYTLDQLKTQFEESSSSFQKLSSKYYLYQD